MLIRLICCTVQRDVEMQLIFCIAASFNQNEGCTWSRLELQQDADRWNKEEAAGMISLNVKTVIFMELRYYKNLVPFHILY